MHSTGWSISDYAAWYGAGIGTLTFGWTIFREWRSGPRIKLRASPNMVLLTDTPETQNTTYILVKAVNIGKAATTITSFHGYHSSDKGKRQNFVIPLMPLSDTLPYVLKPGEEWKHMVDHAALQRRLGSGYVYLAVTHNQRKRPVYAKKVRI